MPTPTATPLLPPGTIFPTGLVVESKDTKLHRLARTMPFLKRISAPVEVTYTPIQLSYWGNDRYGICVTSEEAYAKACFGSRVFWPEADCIAWARKRGWLNGASLDGVMDDMIKDGFAIGPQKYFDGAYHSVDFSDEAILNAALLEGPVKIAINASALPSGAGSVQGWYVFGDNSNTRTNHSVSIGGGGTAQFLFDKMGITRPSSIPPNKWCYKIFSWSTEGIVDHEWLMGTTDEAHIRNPTTVGIPPLTPPTPITTTTTTTTTPRPGPSPGPSPSPYMINVPQGLPPGNYLAFPNTPV